jgi:hypothetical protein
MTTYTHTALVRTGVALLLASLTACTGTVDSPNANPSVTAAVTRLPLRRRRAHR